MNFFASLHPFTTMLYITLSLLISMLSMNPIILIISLLSSVIWYISLNHKDTAFDDISFYIPLFVLIAVTNPLFVHKGESILFFMNDKPITLEAIIYGVMLSVSLIGIIFKFKCFNILITPDKFLYLFGRIMPKISLIISITLTFIPRLKRKFKSLKKTHIAISLYGSGSYTDKIIGELKIFYSLIAASFENAIMLSDLMRARGYGVKKRSSAVQYKFAKYDYLLCALFVILSLPAIIFLLLGRLDFYYYPSLQLHSLTASEIIVYILWGIFSLIPPVIEFKESLTWKLLISKI